MRRLTIVDGPYSGMSYPVRELPEVLELSRPRPATGTDRYRPIRPGSDHYRRETVADERDEQRREYARDRGALA